MRATPVQTKQGQGRGLGFFGGGLFVLVGLVMSTGIVAGVVHEHRVYTVYREASCTVLARRPASGKNAPAAYLDVSFPVADRAHVVSNVSLQKGPHAGRFVPKQAAPCFYDPDDPDKVELERPSGPVNAGLLVFALVPVLFLVLGLRELLQALHDVGKSREAILAEKVMARAHRERRRAPAAASPSPYRAPRTPRGPDDLEGLPLPEVVTVAGETLPFRLLRDHGRVAQVGILGLIAVVWSSFVSIFVIGAVQHGSVGIGLFMLPFVIVGVILLATVAQRILLFAVREPILELDAHPLRHGAPARLAITQRGPLHATRMTVTLRGTEEAISGSGKHQHTSTRVFLECELVDELDLRIQRGKPWTREVTLALPADAPASFASARNALRYQIVVKTVIPHYPDDENAYPLLLLPPGRGATDV